MNKQKMIDEVLEECRKQLNEAYNNDRIELGPTEVELINKYLGTIAYPIELFKTGTLLNCGGWEAFCITKDELERRWVSGYGGERTHDEMFVSILLHRDHVFLLHKGY